MLFVYHDVDTSITSWRGFEIRRTTEVGWGWAKNLSICLPATHVSNALRPRQLEGAAWVFQWDYRQLQSAGRALPISANWRSSIAKKDFDELMSTGIDVGKDTFHIVGFDPTGQRILRKQIKRLAFTATFKKSPCCIAGMDACLSALTVGRILREMGFEPRTIPAI